MHKMGREVATNTRLYPLEEVIELQRLLQDRYRQIREEHPVQANTALDCHIEFMRCCHGKALGESGLTDQELQQLYDTEGLAMNPEEQIAFDDAMNILLLMATVSSRDPDPTKIRQSIEIMGLIKS